MSDDRSERLRRNRNRAKEKAQSSESSEQSQPAQPDEQSEPSETDETDQMSVKDEYTGVYMYLPEEQKNDLGPTYKIISAEYEREFNEELEKNRHFYPLVIQYGLDGLDGLDASEIKERLEEIDIEP